ADDARHCRAPRRAAGRLHHPPEFGGFELGLVGEPIFDIAPGRIAALKEAVQQIAPARAVRSELRAHTGRAQLLKFFTLVDRQHARRFPLARRPAPSSGSRQTILAGTAGDGYRNPRSFPKLIAAVPWSKRQTPASGRCGSEAQLGGPRSRDGPARA